jgi:hypothetical protein
VQPAECSECSEREGKRVQQMFKPSSIALAQTSAQAYTMAPKRARSVANPLMSETMYFENMRSYVQKETLWARVGPHLCSEGSGIAPSMVVKVAPLCEAFINAGCRNGVVFPSRLETAAKRLINSIKPGCAMRYGDWSSRHNSITHGRSGSRPPVSAFPCRSQAT